MKVFAVSLSLVMTLALPQPAFADVTIGVTLALTGPAATLGAGAKSAVSMMPSRIGDTAVTFVVLDDASDVTAAVINANKLISQYKVDVLIGPSTSPQGLAVIDPAAQSNTPVIALGSSRWLVEPMDAKHRWVFKPVPNDDIWMDALIDSWKRNDVKKLAFFGFDDAYGETLLTELQHDLSGSGIDLVDTERFNSRDMSVTAQALKIIGARPDAVVIAASGTPALLPEMTLKEHGYNGLVYQNNPAATREFLKNGGKRVDGTLVVAAPCLVYEQLPDDHPVKAPCKAFNTRYEAANGPGSRSIFAFQAFDAWTLLAAALPAALKTATPGTPGFRRALRDALEAITNLPGNGGVYSMSATSHMGLDQRGAVIIKAEDGAWKLVP